MDINDTYKDHSENFNDYYDDNHENFFDFDDTLVTNMENVDKKRVIHAIKLNNLEDTLIIDKIALLYNGIRDISMFSLRINKPTDLTYFWKTFDELNFKIKGSKTLGELLEELI